MINLAIHKTWILRKFKRTNYKDENQRAQDFQGPGNILVKHMKVIFNTGWLPESVLKQLHINHLFHSSQSSFYFGPTQ